MAAGFLLCGCLATQRDILDLENQMDELKDELTGEIGRFTKTMGNLQTNQADLSVKMDEVRTDLVSFTEDIRETSRHISRLLSRLDDIETGLGQKLQVVDAKITKATAPPPGPTPSQIFREASIALGNKKYNLAIKGFSLYLRNYPKGEVADLATYNLGVAYYSKKSWTSAARSFAKVLDKYPKSSLTPAARLRYALSMLKLGPDNAAKREEARRYLQSVIHDFPKSAEAKAAAKHLKDMTAKKSPARKKQPQTKKKTRKGQAPKKKAKKSQAPKKK